MYLPNLSLVTAMAKQTLSFHLNTFQRKQSVWSDSDFIVFQFSAKVFISLYFVDFFIMDIFSESVFVCILFALWK